MPFVLLLALGRLLDYLKIFPPGADKSLNLYVIYIALPALILRQVPGLAFSGEYLAPLIMPWLVLLFSGLLVFLLCRLLHWSREITGALLLMVPLGNTAFLGLPMVEHFFGPEAVSSAVLYDQFGSFLILSSYGAFILALYGSGEKPRPWVVLKKVLTFPPFLTLLVALFLRGIVLPAWWQPNLSLISQSMTPVVMVSIGIQMRLFLPRHELLPLALGLVLRLLITPLIFLWACRYLQLSGRAVQVALLETAMPSMIMASVLASVAGLKPRLTSAMAAYGIGCAFVTLPIIYNLVSA
ncbi:MAG: AEC family transporter [Candidatus Electrothrix sp. GW3-4]|uniref:AEC family transporter n=1 Tax=Candidatus Electrothrix sp. GW3-4 TaxID=3126740 RepID=UPI0030D04FE2